MFMSFQPNSIPSWCVFLFHALIILSLTHFDHVVLSGLVPSSILTYSLKLKFRKVIFGVRNSTESNAGSHTSSRQPSLPLQHWPSLPPHHQQAFFIALHSSAHPFPSLHPRDDTTPSTHDPQVRAGTNTVAQTYCVHQDQVCP